MQYWQLPYTCNFVRDYTTDKLIVHIFILPGSMTYRARPGYDVPLVALPPTCTPCLLAELYETLNISLNL